MPGSAQRPSVISSDRQFAPNLNPPLRSPNAIDTSLLIPPQPRLPRLPQNTFPDEINDQSTDDANERDGIHPVYMQMKHLDSDRRAPKVPRQQGNVEEGRGRETEEDGGAAVEDEEQERVAGEVAADFAVVPDGIFILWSVENSRHGAVDEHAPEAELAYNFVQGSLGDEEFFRHVTHAVEGRADQGEEIPFQLIAARDAAEAGTLGDVIGAEEDADATDADEDADDLGRVVANVEEDEGNQDDHYDGPEVDELSG